MIKYHINPVTGNAGKCSAKFSCPFGDLEQDHYDSKESAVEAYEKAMAGTGWKPAEKINHTAVLNEGELQEIHLGFRTLLNDLAELQVTKIFIGGRMFERKGGHLYENNHRYNITKKDLENFSNILHDGDRLATTLAAEELSKKLGFAGLPKAPSQEKIDITFATKDGVEVRASVKAFTGAKPSLMSASQTTAVRFEQELSPGELETVTKILAEREEKKLHESVVLPRLEEAVGFQLTYDKARLENNTFKDTLEKTAGENASDAMLRKLISKRDPNVEEPALEVWNAIVGGFATKAVPTGVLPRSKQANALIDIYNNGEIVVTRASSSEELGAHLAPRINIEKSGKPKTEFLLEGNKLVVRTFASLRIKAGSH